MRKLDFLKMRQHDQCCTGNCHNRNVSHRDKCLIHTFHTFQRICSPFAAQTVPIFWMIFTGRLFAKNLTLFVVFCFRINCWEICNNGSCNCQCVYSVIRIYIYTNILLWNLFIIMIFLHRLLMSITSSGNGISYFVNVIACALFLSLSIWFFSNVFLQWCEVFVDLGARSFMSVGRELFSPASLTFLT